MQRILQKILFISFLLGLFQTLGCYAPKFIPKDLQDLKTTEELGAATQRAYQQTKIAQTKNEKLDAAHAGIVYSEKCLKLNSRVPSCLYFGVLNRGVYIQNNFINYQQALKKMIAGCETLIAVQPSYENAGCYRVLGDIYAKVPSFSLSSNSITQDLDKSAEYLRGAVKVSPDYALNHLFLSRTLEALGEKEAAKKELEEFDRLSHAGLDSEYPEWKKERNSLAEKLHIKTGNL